MPPIFIIMYALLVTASLFLIYFLILRHFGMSRREAIYALFWCFIVGIIVSIMVDYSSDQIGFIK